MKLNLQFIGATGTVTGSKYLLTTNESKVLIDCGLFQGLKVMRERNRKPLPFRENQIDAIVLTHAHLDHSGFIPLIVKNGFKGSIYCTPATNALCDILLPDSGHLQEEDAEFANKHKFSKHSPALSLYTEKDARTSLKYLKNVEFNKKVKIAKDISAEFFPAGHILGSSIVRLSINGIVVTFSGDIGRQKNTTHFPPSSIPNTDYLILESTYGDRVHSDENPEEVIEKIIIDTIQRGGRLLIPSFAVGRAQQILYLIYKLQKRNSIPEIPVFVDSPMASEATKIFLDYSKESKIPESECREFSRIAKFIESAKDSKNLSEDKTPSIIISASGMATGGRVLHHLKIIAPNPKNSILFAGYQAPGTRGEAMVKGNKLIKIHGEQIPVNAKVFQLDTLSAHADSEEIITWLKTFQNPPKTTYITHGEPSASETMRKKIREELGWDSTVPDYLEEVELH
ncbi:MAG: MBL fold metallo-hydrolase [Leptospiraceae bacterium]|nr:MBL fold metallo-hydrolase [Leptospiraceae bacterium]MCK6382445.1 MBL fold metallo-hydrolase [Leptospiraceae bacterium]NUM41394.1 MBL fold metallo-hydrolase [Leptospiraceae bacterium]